MPKKTISPEDVAQNPLQRFREVFSEIPAPKGGLPTMPTRISELPSDELGDLIARYTAWREFAEDRHLEACAVFAQAKSEYDLECDKEMIRSGEGTAKERLAEAHTMPGVVLLGKRLKDAEVYKELFANKLESFSNVLAMLSRELTRRGVEIQR